MNRRISFTLLFILISNIYLACHAQNLSLNDKHAGFVKANALSHQTCIACHKKQAIDWHGSDHQKSMAVADPDSVKGNLKNQLAEHFGQKAHFYKKGEQFLVSVTYDKK